MQRSECVFVGDVVAQEHYGGGANRCPDGAQSLAFVGGNQQKLANHLPVAHNQLADGVGDLGQLGQDRVDFVGVDFAVVDRHRGRLLLQRNARMNIDQRLEGLEQPGTTVTKHRVEIEREIYVELGAVGPNQMNFGRQAAQHRQVSKRPSRDHGNLGVGQRRQGSQGDRCFSQRQRLHRVVDNRCHRAVVVAGHQQDRRLREQRDPRCEVGVIQHVGTHARRRYCAGRR